MRRHDDAIVHPLALAAGGDDACITQVGEVAGDLWLGRGEDLDEIADADFLLAHQVEQAEACGIAEGLKEAWQIESGAVRHMFYIYALTYAYARNRFCLANMCEVNHGRTT